ncbi:MAG: glycosyltransferase family 2 protein [Gemmatimonadetes bacterium]|nr:glycosyltransferase family 2 protein [Gemmatimonadota bacterium]
MKIGIALCTYNGAPYLREQLQSIAAQSRLPDSLVAVDDASSDTTVEILHDFAREAPFPVRVEQNERNLGYARNFGRAIELAEGEAIALADQDDFWYPHKLATMEAAFCEAPDVGMFFSDADVVDAELRSLGHRLWQAIRLLPDRQQEVRAGDALGRLLRGCYVTGATMAFRSEFRELVLPVSERSPHDAWIALLVAAVARVNLIAEPLIAYRQHGSNQIGVRHQLWVKQWEEQRRKNLVVLQDVLWRAVDARERLEQRGRLSAETRQALDEVIEHFSVRTGLPSSRLRRLTPILRELVRARYRGRCGGVAGAARDLFM